jgi:hypothetical protein
MSVGIQLSLESLSLETRLNVLNQGLPIKDLRHLRGTSRDLRLAVDDFVRGKLIRLKTQGPSTLSDFLATQQPVTSNNAWRILGLLKQTYPSLPLNISIEKALQDLNRQLDQATIALKNALVLQDAGAFSDLALKQTAEQIRNWFSNPINHPLLQNVTELNLEGRGLSLIPSELSFLSNLERLSLSQNQITKIPPQTFATLPNLKCLSLRKNQLTAIDSQTFTNLSNLVELDLEINQLTEIKPETFSNLVNLQHLYLRKNQLRAIALNTFANLANLRWLFLRNNPMTAAGPIDRASLGLRQGVRLFS